MEETTINEVVELTTNTELLQQIHNDLSIVVCFLVFFTIVIILKYIYKFFNMIFQF